MNNAATTYQPASSLDEANVLNTVFLNLMGKVNTYLPCKIITANSDNSYDIQSLVNNLSLSTANNGVSGTLNPVPPPIISNVPCTTIQQDNCGIELPAYAINDVVLVGFFQRDCSAVINSGWTQQNPGSLRKFSYSDAIIIGKINTGTTPTFSIKLENNGDVTITGNKVNVNATNVNLGAGANLGILTEGTQFQITGVQAGGDTITNTISVYNNTQSNTIKATP